MLRFQLLLFSITASILAAVCVGLISFNLSARTVIQLNNENMMQTALSAEKEIKQWLHDINAEAARWSLHHVLRRATEDTYIGRASRRQASAWLAEQIEKRFQFDAVILADESGEILASAENEETDIEFLSSFPKYFEMSENADKIPHGEIYLWYNNRPAFVKIMKLVRKSNNNKRFYIVALMNIDNIIDTVFIPRNKDKEASYVILIDTKTKTPIGYTDYYKNNKSSGPSLTYSHPLQYPEWTVEVKSNRKYVIRPAFSLAEKVSGVCLITLLLYLVIKFFFIQKLIFSPVASMTDTIRLITSQKNFSLRSSYKGFDEIGELSEGFNSMLDEIEQRDFKLIRAKNEISETSERLAAALNSAEENRNNAEKANIKKTEFLQNLSYRLRSPLNSILLLSEEIYNESLTHEKSPEKKNILKIIHDGIKNLSCQIDNIRNFSDENIEPPDNGNNSQSDRIIHKTDKPAILLVDNNMRQMFLLSRILTERNFRVLPASDSHDIITRVAEEKPAFIFISSKFPENEKNAIIKAVDNIVRYDAEDTVVAWLD